MAGYTKTNLRDVENQAPNFGMPEEMDARFARTALGGKTLGLSLLKLAPNFRMPFGHKHTAQEEVYVVVRGSGRIKVDDEIVEVAEWDAIRFDEDTMRNVEAAAASGFMLVFPFASACVASRTTSAAASAMATAGSEASSRA